MSILITGAAGFVGLHLLEVLLGRGEHVVGLSAGPIPAPVAARLAALPGRLVEVTGDVRDAALLAATLAEHGVERVAHLAAITASSEREKASADTVLDVNLGGLATVIKACADAGVARFLYASSIAVFGGVAPDGSLIEEDAPHAGGTLYAITKSAGEAVTARLAGLHGIDWVVARLGRVFGPYEYATGVRDTLSQVYQATALARAGRPFLFGRPCIKNWNYGPDVAANLATLLLAPEHAHGVYNLGTPYAWSLQAWCALLAARLPHVRYDVGTAPATTSEALEIDLGGARDSGLLSWQRFYDEFAPPPPHSLESAFAHYLGFLDQQESWTDHLNAARSRA
jgi:UDP-glucuronate 4-epimerase